MLVHSRSSVVPGGFNYGFLYFLGAVLVAGLTFGMFMLFGKFMSFPNAGMLALLLGAVISAIMEFFGLKNHFMGLPAAVWAGLVSVEMAFHPLRRLGIWSYDLGDPGSMVFTYIAAVLCLLVAALSVFIWMGQRGSGDEGFNDDF